MATRNYQLSWKYYAEFTELRSNVNSNTEYTILPKNGQLVLPSTIRFYVYDIFGNRKYTLTQDQVTFSNYNMSVAGEYQLTATYICPNGQSLTNTDFHITVFGDSTWRTLWSGSENVKLTHSHYYVNGVDVGQKCSICDVASDTFKKYIGSTYTRKIRFTYSVNCNSNSYTLYMGNSQTSFTKDVSNTTTINFNYLTQNDGSIDSSNTTYYTAYKTIAIDHYDSLTDTYQIICGQIKGGSKLLSFATFYKDHPSQIFYDNDGHEITITKIEVQE